MMIEQATVLHYRNGIARIQCFAKSGCGGCTASGCGTKSLSALAGEKVAPQFELAVSQELQTGDIIEIGIAEHSLLQSIFLLYVLPLFVLISSTLLFSVFVENELLLAVCVLGCTFGIFSVIRVRIKRYNLGQLMPVFVRKC